MCMVVSLARIAFSCAILNYAGNIQHDTIGLLGDALHKLNKVARTDYNSIQFLFNVSNKCHALKNKTTFI